MRSIALGFGNVFLVSALLLAAACGGGAGPGPQGPATAPSSGAPTGAPGEHSTAPTGSAATSGPTAPGPMKAIAASAMGADLAALGLDAQKLPPLSKLEPDKLRKVMKTFSKALGTPCTGCHDANDFRAPTPKKKIAGKMWDAYVRGLVLEDGSALYCDSCHAGHMEFLDRHDKRALGKWMDANYVDRLKRVDAKDNACETCHGEDMDMHFLAAWSK